MTFSCGMVEVFQSAPPVETRGDECCREYTFLVLCFNPLPPSKRGETRRIRLQVNRNKFHRETANTRT